MKAAIMGYGPVGQATELLLLCADVECEIQDPLFVDKMIQDWDEIDLAFICVPSDLIEETGRLDLSCVNKAIDDVPDSVHCVVRSTIGPDQIKDLIRPSSVMPEFIREHHWEEDVLSNKTPCVIGCNGDSVPEIESLARKFQEYFMNPIVTDPESAMMMKMTINTFLAMKVAFANNVWVLAKSLGVSYTHLKQLLQLDERLGKSHWDVPGPSGKFGFGGKCFPKDATHYASMANSELIDEVLKYKI
jgi:UDP-glucose 6-dehydrogenase